MLKQRDGKSGEKKGWGTHQVSHHYSIHHGWGAVSPQNKLQTTGRLRVGRVVTVPWVEKMKIMINYDEMFIITLMERDIKLYKFLSSAYSNELTVAKVNFMGRGVRDIFVLLKIYICINLGFMT